MRGKNNELLDEEFKMLTNTTNNNAGREHSQKEAREAGGGPAWNLLRA